MKQDYQTFDGECLVVSIVLTSVVLSYNVKKRLEFPGKSSCFMVCVECEIPSG